MSTVGGVEGWMGQSRLSDDELDEMTTVRLPHRPCANGCGRGGMAYPHSICVECIAEKRKARRS